MFMELIVKTNYSFGEPETDYWIQRYEKTLTGDKPTEEYAYKEYIRISDVFFFFTVT